MPRVGTSEHGRRTLISSAVQGRGQSPAYLKDFEELVPVAVACGVVCVRACDSRSLYLMQKKKKKDSPLTTRRRQERRHCVALHGSLCGLAWTSGEEEKCREDWCAAAASFEDTCRY